MGKKKRRIITFRSVLILFTVVLVGYVIHLNWADILETMEHIQETNVFVLLLLIPEQLFMYFACGQIFFSYLKHQRNVHKFSNSEIMRISTELNFVNHAVPAGGVGGLAFLTYRLGAYGVTAGQASFLYIFRYAVTTVVNYLQALVAILILMGLGMIPDEAQWVMPLALLMNTGLLLGLWLMVSIASSRKRIKFVASLVEKASKAFAKFFTFGKKRKIIKDKTIEEYFEDIHQSLKMAKDNNKYLRGPITWGIIYSFFEIGTYWIVAISLGRPELLPFIMVGEAIGSVFDGIVPYGLYELGMAGVMIALGVDFPTATIITVMTRVITLLFTIASGSVPYYKAIKDNRQ